MEVKPVPLGARRAGFDEDESEDGACAEEQPPGAREKTSVAKQS